MVTRCVAYIQDATKLSQDTGSNEYLNKVISVRNCSLFIRSLLKKDRESFMKYLFLFGKVNEWALLRTPYIEGVSRNNIAYVVSSNDWFPRQPSY